MGLQNRIISLFCCWFITCIIVFSRYFLINIRNKRKKNDSKSNPITTESDFKHRGKLLRSITSTSATTVALLVPVRSKHGKFHVSQLTIFQELLPSLFSRIHCDNRYFVQYVIYVGYDAGDTFFDNQINLEGFVSTYEALWTKATHQYPQLSNMLPPKLVLRRYVGMISSPCWVWNELFKEAYHDTEILIDYFFQVNDDIQLLSNCWAYNLVSVLKHVPRRLGVVGPMDIQNTKVLTQALVSRTHYEIFQTFYPRAFKNWYSDDWLSLVYSQGRTYMVDTVKILNTNSQGTRYKKFTKVKSLSDLEVDQGRRQIERWLEQKREEDAEIE